MNEAIVFGEEIIKNYLNKNIDLIILKGKMGVGKTTIVKGIAKGLGIDDVITSPSYGYKKEYDGLIHYDLYLTKKMKSDNLESLISDDIENNLVVVEWGEKLPKINNSMIIEIKLINITSRLINVKLI